jgi:hypothetical protein
LDTTSVELVPKLLNEELPVFHKPSMDLPIAGEQSKGYDLNDTLSAPALPASLSDDVEMKVAGLERIVSISYAEPSLPKSLTKRSVQFINRFSFLMRRFKNCMIKLTSSEFSK